jgi:hypothetical protein
LLLFSYYVKQEIQRMGACLEGDLGGLKEDEVWCGCLHGVIARSQVVKEYEPSFPAVAVFERLAGPVTVTLAPGTSAPLSSVT